LLLSGLSNHLCLFIFSQEKRSEDDDSDDEDEDEDIAIVLNNDKPTLRFKGGMRKLCFASALNLTSVSFTT
jgi:hypothetical protein